MLTIIIFIALSLAWPPRGRRGPVVSRRRRQRRRRAPGHAHRRIGRAGKSSAKRTKSRACYLAAWTTGPDVHRRLLVNRSSICEPSCSKPTRRSSPAKFMASQLGLAGWQRAVGVAARLPMATGLLAARGVRPDAVDLASVSRKRRLAKFAKQLPEALELISPRLACRS